MINLRVGLALCKLLELNPDLVADISLETHVNGRASITLTRYLNEEEIKHLEDVIEGVVVEEELT